MKIKHITLQDHVRLQVSRINKLHVGVDNEIQLIIGSNGSGKSTLIGELFPTVHDKSSFNKNGYKSLILEHNGDDYELTYDSKTGHCFYRNGTNLNISNTGEIQKQLILEHLGIDNSIVSILKCSLPICDMAPSQRKKILLNMNPIDIDIFITKQQKVRKDITYYENNLNRLYMRQKQLVEKRIPDQQYVDMLNNKEVLENKEKILLMLITYVSNELSKITKIEKRHNITRHDIIPFIRRLFKHKEVRNIDAVKYEVDYKVITNDIEKLECDIKKLITSINDSESKYDTIVNIADDIDVKLNELNNKLNDYNISDDFVPIPVEYMECVMLLANQLSEILINLTYITYNKILSADELTELKYKLSEKRSTLINNENQIKQLINDLDITAKGIKIYTIGDCAKDECELYQAYKANFDNKTARVNDLSSKIDILKKNNEDIKNELDSLNELYENQKSIWQHINKVITLIMNNKVLYNKYSTDNILAMINNTPLTICNEIRNYVEQSNIYYEYVDVKNNIQKLEITKASATSKKQVSINMLFENIVAQKSKLNELRMLYDKYVERRNDIVTKLDMLKQFNDDKRQLNNLYEYINKDIENIAKESDHVYLDRLLNIFNKLLNNTRNELVNIIKICKEQEMLISRLDNEIECTIKEMKPKLINAKYVERSIVDLSSDYTITFINNLIETTNYFINKIVTYPIRLLPMDKNSNCDFNFPLMINNDVVTKDISKCSDGQKAIIQLAFNLAMIIELKYNKYPIACDEMDRALDMTHSKKLTDMLIELINSGLISQLFVAAHEPSFVKRFSNIGNIIILNGDNIDLPDKYNVNTKIERN